MRERRPITNADFNYIRDLVRDQSALTLEAGKEYLLESRLDPLARLEGFSSYADLVRRLRGEPFTDLHQKVVEAMTNNETTFFRDARVFGMLATSILPALIAARSAERSLNIWCAACSTGQEPYSVAMLLHEHRPSLEGWKIRIVATDISRDVLVRARGGRYSQIEINRGLPATKLVKYFAQHGSTWELAPEIRRMVEFRELNLIKSWESLPAVQLILMRNVLIYFDVAAKKAILEKVGHVLDPRGYLLLGGAETTTNLAQSFEPVSLGGAVCFRPKWSVVSSP
jgi:chemotaxis protein methyltransferase CheR